jgi:GalNAc5-diNAcBac-PP-undecaprenol beta-1,3-glucosyltransferase
MSKTTEKDINPTISVVIPTYKRATLVPRAINSVLQQTYQDFEIIVVDDCSPDNTQDAVMAISDRRIRYLRHDINKGLPAGRNTGIDAARGEYIAFLDDDDEWHPDKLEVQLKAIKGYDAVLSGALINNMRVKLHRRIVVTVDDLRKGNEFDPSSLLAKTSVLRDLRFDESLRQGEDWDAFIRIAQKYSIGYVAEPLLLYNDGGHERMTNQAKNLSIAELEKRMPVLHKHQLFFGSYWFRYHVADTYLAYIALRQNKVAVIRYAVARCGLLPVFRALGSKVVKHIKQRVSTTLK